VSLQSALRQAHPDFVQGLRTHPEVSRALLRAWLPTHPYLAQAPSPGPKGLQPHQWEGGLGHCSAVIQTGTRVWCFQTHLQRERFLAQVPGSMALSGVP
jgi:hypothetical protein